MTVKKQREIDLSFALAADTNTAFFWLKIWRCIRTTDTGQSHQHLLIKLTSNASKDRQTSTKARQQSRHQYNFVA
jgi:hypothetical protein